MNSFSVLLSLYYKENPSFLRESLNSIFSQSILPNEVVLVEDGPLTDEQHTVVKEFEGKYSNLKVIPLPLNVGLGKALNEGLKHCSYDIVARMDTDDIAKPDRFEKQIKFMEQHPDIDVCSAWVSEFHDNIDNIISLRRIPETHEEIFNYGKRRNPVNHPVVVFRKHAVESAGGYKPFYLFEDYYLWVRMLVGGFKFYNIQEPLLYFRTSKDMYGRRGGLKYARTECGFLWTMHRLRYISFPSALFGICIRTVIRIIPNNIRKWVYMNILHRKHQ